MALIKSIKNIIPRGLKKNLTLSFNEVYRANHLQKYLRREKEIPVFELEELHLKNLVALPNRNSLLEKLPRNSIGGELGVDTGGFSEMILKYAQPKKLHLIDVWNSTRYNLNKKLRVEEKFVNQIKSGQVEINIGYSTQLVAQFKDGYFDWIYIDTDHSYGTTRDELNLYASKIKKGGIIAGHDYEVAHWNGLSKFGVIEAVNEFCVLNNWEFVYLTMENREHRSFAIRKI